MELLRQVFHLLVASAATTLLPLCGGAVVVVIVTWCSLPLLRGQACAQACVGCVVREMETRPEDCCGGEPQFGGQRSNT